LVFTIRIRCERQILHQDRIELVVVASRALNGHSQHALADRAKHIVQVVVAPRRIGVFMIANAGTRAQEAGGDQAAIGPVGNLVAGDLFLYKSVVGLVVIEGFDDVVAISPKVRLVRVVLIAARVCIACGIQPVAAPSLSVNAATRVTCRSTVPTRPEPVFAEGHRRLRRRQRGASVKADCR
jgi:hypothetical protein